VCGPSFSSAQIAIKDHPSCSSRPAARFRQTTRLVCSAQSPWMMAAMPRHGRAAVKVFQWSDLNRARTDFCSLKRLRSPASGASELGGLWGYVTEQSDDPPSDHRVAAPGSCFVYCRCHLARKNNSAFSGDGFNESSPRDVKLQGWRLIACQGILRILPQSPPSRPPFFSKKSGNFRFAG
jgi:hypothetical protein